MEPGACHPSYAGACVPIAEDVDCSREANGPAYVDARDFQRVGEDVYGLDANDNGIACESTDLTPVATGEGPSGGTGTRAGTATGASQRGLARTGTVTEACTYLGVVALCLGVALVVISQGRSRRERQML